MAVSDIASSEFGHVQLLDMPSLAKRKRADTMAVIQDTLVSGLGT